MKIGIQLPEVEYEYSWHELSTLAVLAEMSGFDSIWLGDHLMYRQGTNESGPYEAFTTLAALAAVTSRVELGPLVASLSFHNPAMIAKMAATIDQISNGRFILGVGSGWNETEYRGYGFPFEHRVARFAESFAVIHQFFATGRCTFHGEYWDIEGGVLFPRLLRPGGPPLMVGSHGKRMLSITLPHVQMWNAWYTDYDNDRAKLPALLAEIDAACEQADRDPGTLQRSICPLVTFERTDRTISPNRMAATIIDGDDPARLADEFYAYEQAGIAHLQLVLDPITPASIEAAAKALALYRG